jgi:hypothetical protein
MFNIFTASSVIASANRSFSQSKRLSNLEEYQSDKIDHMVFMDMEWAFIAITIIAIT